MDEDGEKAMVLAAGLGTRMRPLTENTPKPLVRVAGRPLIDYSMDTLKAAGIHTAIVNMHYLADQIEAWAHTVEGVDIILSDESDALLDTGGGVAKVLPIFEDEPFFLLNSDSFCSEGDKPVLQRMRDAWNPLRMDCLLLLSKLDRSIGFSGRGDFMFSEGGSLQRAGDGGEALAYTGCLLMTPELFKDAPRGIFSMNLIWDKALANGRLHGLVHDGYWLHVGTPESVEEAERHLAGKLQSTST